MKTLSIIQPWAHAIFHHGKDYENRNWPTQYRGPLLIHAGKSYDKEAETWVMRYMGHWAANETPETPRGGIVGVAYLSGLLHADELGVVRIQRGKEWERIGDEEDQKFEWLSGPGYGFMLDIAKPVPFAPLRGHLGLFNVDVEGLPAETAAEIKRWVWEAGPDVADLPEEVRAEVERWTKEDGP